jgi:hypothetical protein
VQKFFGSTPHSKGDLYSRSSLIFIDIKVVMIIMAVNNRIASIAVVLIIIIIIYLVFHRFIVWKSSILSLY